METAPGNPSRVVIVTGGAKGIGRATCRAFVESGDHVLCLDTDADAGAALVGAVGGPGDLRFQAADVTRPEDCRAAAAVALETWGRIDVLVNNAGIQPIDSYVLSHELPESLWDRILDVNLKSAYLLGKEVFPIMQEQAEGGVIVNIASVQGIQSAPLVAAYAASKGGLLSLTRQWALDYAKFGIRVVAVNPGTIETPLVAESAEAHGLSMEEARAQGAENHPIGRVGQPEEIARVIRFVASPEASFMTGESVNVDGGLMAKGAWA